MKKLFFDAGPIISLAMNNLLWTLKPLKERFGGEFCITKRVKEEITNKPFKTKKYKFEALQVMRLLKDGILTVVENKKIENLASELQKLANQCFKFKGRDVQIVQLGEMEIIAALVLSEHNIMVIDERTTRRLIENPEGVAKLMERRMRGSISTDNTKLNLLSEKLKGIQCIRSSEIVMVTYELGILNHFLPNLPNPKEELLDGLLWGIKLNGCAITGSEINEIKRIEKKLK